MLYGLNLGDVHLGIPSVSITELITAFKKNLISLIIEERRPLDILNIAGDLFDRQIHFGRESGFEILSFFIWLLKFCEDNKIILNVLEGTPSHDWKQNRVLEALAKEHTDIKFNYFNDIAIWFYKEISFLFVPDEWSPDSQTTLSAIKKKLVEAGLSTVDIVVMHGQFEYQLPEIAHSKKTFDSLTFSQLVNHAVLVNHIHTHLPHGKVIPPGSLGRYKHGEEEPKGMVYWTLNNGEFSWEFIENPYATVFKTLKLPKDYDKCLKIINTLVTENPVGSHFRFDIAKTHPVRKIITDLSVRYPGFYFAELVEDEEKSQAVKVIEELPPVEINEQNYLLFLDHYLALKVKQERIELVKKRIQYL